MNWYDAASEYHERTFPHDGSLSSLPTEWQRELVALILVGQEVNNGGYLQFLANHGREAYEYASQALKAIGAHRMAEIIDHCQALVDEHFLSEGRPSEQLRQLLPNEIIDREGRTIKEPGSVLPDDIIARVLALSYEFMDYPDNVDELAQSHYQGLIESESRTEPPG